ncbi:MAG: hypothetical protein QM523_00930 [Candidatus Pacebacteria bacterium]|nr:hypothetical protein [Candidatus Paceibacterota bacterium]
MTDQPQWTPGPWVRDNNDGYSINRIFADARGHHAIAEIIGDGAETEANGDLIAAAPDLYAALETVARDMTAAPWVIEVCEAALRKARGEA